jgi:hypothetical protein
MFLCGLVFRSCFFCCARVAQVRESFKPLLGEKLSVDVEAALFALQSAVGAVYKNQWRDIIANLKDPKNDLKLERTQRACSSASTLKLRI